MRLPLALIAVLIATPSLLPAETTGTLTVTVRDNQTLRDIAKEYLGNPNLWIDILRANDLTSAADIKVGMSLKIPANELTRSNRALQDALAFIDKATMVGARLFAPEIITNAIETRNKAIAERNKGRYKESYTFARQSKGLASKALDISIANQNVPAQAIINYKKGSVQRRDVKGRAWKDASVNTVLLEGERVRTLSESNAGILFRDESRLRLDQNSLALIQKMRSNKLKNTQNSSIMLLEGDLSAFLTGSKKGANFHLEIPDIDTTIRSTRFWVSRDEKSTRFSNYDGELEISTAEDKLVLGKNQGSVVGRRQKRLSLHNLLPRASLISPASFATVPSNRLVLEWESIKGAHSYWLEVSTDKMFNRAVYSEKAFTSTRYVWEKVPPDIYYWRVSAVDKEGLPGPKSEVRVINVVKDTTPPYLLVNTPSNEAFVRDGIITITGEAELGVTACVGENTLKLDPSGNFLSWIPLSDGSNVLSIEARDEAGNVTQRELKLIYLPDSELAVFNFDGTTNQISPNHFLVQEKGFILLGKTMRDSSVSLKSLESTYKASTYADESGFFHFSVPISHSREDFICTRRTPSDQVTEERLVVEIRSGNPSIQFTQPLPEVTTEQSLTLEGKLLNGRELRINGRKVSLSEGAFMETIELKPGTNSIRLEAYDEVKNLTIVNKRVLLDRQAPTLLNVALSQEKARGGELIHIEIHANDHSMMKRSAPFTIMVGSFVYDGFLTLSRAHNVYTGDVYLPLNAHGKVELTKLLLEDYYGNRREYLF